MWGDNESLFLNPTFSILNGWNRTDFRDLKLSAVVSCQVMWNIRGMIASILDNKYTAGLLHKLSNPIQCFFICIRSVQPSFSHVIRQPEEEIKVWNYSMNKSINFFFFCPLYSSSLRSCILFSVFLHKHPPPPYWPWCPWVIWFLFISAKLSGLSISPPYHLQLKYVLIQSCP